MQEIREEGSMLSMLGVCNRKKYKGIKNVKMYMGFKKKSCKSSPFLKTDKIRDNAAQMKSVAHRQDVPHVSLTWSKLQVRQCQGLMMFGGWHFEKLPREVFVSSE